MESYLGNKRKKERKKEEKKICLSAGYVILIYPRCMDGQVRFTG